VKHRGALFFASAEDFSNFTSAPCEGCLERQLGFKTLSRLAYAHPSLDTISNCRQCRSAGCLATIDP
jgi:hypothetical protein